MRKLRNAHWIWCSDEQSPINAVANFRAHFRLSRVTGEHTLLISAVDRFVVYVNGRRVGYGPPRNFPEHYQYELFDLGDFLIAGENVLEVTVIHWGEGTFQSLPGRAALIAEVMDQNGRSLLGTDASWLGRPDPSYRRDTSRIACQLGFEEQVQPEEGLGRDSGWKSAVVVGKPGVGSWPALNPSTIPPLTDEIWNSVAVRTCGTWQEPDLVLGLRANAYLTPGNRMVNSDKVHGFFAARLHAPKAGQCVVRRCSMYGGPIRVFVDGCEVTLKQDIFDFKAEVELSKGEHLLLIEWKGITHDKDVAFSFSGISGLRTLCFPRHAGARWIFHAGCVGASAIRRKNSHSELLDGEWRPVATEDAPEHDTYMSISGSVAIDPQPESQSALPMLLEPLGNPRCVHRLIVDFARHGLGFLELDLDASGGGVIELLGCEGSNNGELQLTEMMSNCARYVCREGKQRFSSIVPRGLRYLVLQIQPGKSPVVLHGVRLRVSTYPWKPEGYFRCSDPRLNQIYELCCHTLRMSSMDVFIDATYEQALWVGDMSSMTLPVHFYTQGDPRLPARCLRMVGQSLECFPFAQSQVPSAWTDRPIPNWSFFWVLGVRDHYMFTGDKALVGDLLPALLKQAYSVAAAINDQGLFELKSEAWHFLDWNGLEGDHQASSSTAYAHENLLALASLEATGFLAREVGQKSTGTQFKDVSIRLRKAIRRLFQDTQTGVLSEYALGARKNGITASTQICALVANFLSKQMGEVALKTITPPKDWVPTGTPWMWSLGAAFALRAGYGEEVLKGIRQHWGRMLDQGATTAWEMFEGGHRPGLPTRSWCHGWSAGPAWLLPAFVLGARPVAPGWKRVRIEPVAGDLQWAEGRIPTPHGPIEVAWEKRGGALKVHAKVPHGTIRCRPGVSEPKR